jgi:serine/threonine-protein kinase
LAGLKALAARCLTKELESRLQLVDWADFDIEAPSDALAALKSRLTKQSLSSSAASTGPYDTRLEFARKEFERRFVDRIRSEMIMTCGARLPLTVRTPGPSAAAVYQFVFATPYCREIVCPLSIEWLDDLYARAAGSA